MLVTVLKAQELRSFIDIPSIYLMTNDVENINNDTGLGLDVGYGIGTHHVMAKVSGGIQATTDFDSKEVGKSIYYNLFSRAEAGIGLWKTNGDKCGSEHNRVYTAIAKGGIQFNFLDKEANSDLGVRGRASGSDIYIGGEFGSFILNDYRKNTEIFIDAGYYLDAETIYLKFGFRTFIKLGA